MKVPRTSPLTAILVLSLLMLTTSAHASHNSWWYDDDCGTNGSDPFFVPDGPPSSWHVHTDAAKAYNNCHMFTNTIAASVSDPVNTTR